MYVCNTKPKNSRYIRQVTINHKHKIFDCNPAQEK